MRLGIQSYSLRKMSYKNVLETIKQLGIFYVEAYPKHFPPNDSIKEVLKLHKDLGIKIVAHGVNHMKNNEKELRNLFDFASNAELEVLTADPDDDALNLINDLAKEYNVKVAIHNHGPNHRWGSFKRINEFVNKLDYRVGMCLDLAHLVRYGENPIEAIEALSNRIHDVHLKDVDKNGNDVILGTGVVDVKGVLSKIKEMKIDIPIMIEYEPDPDNPIPGIKKSLEYLKKLGINEP
ncbi:MAG: sugar phosphate isomerase/epimerase [Saccharolobus sp.]|uniref:sugar phosphate isomerase/epimerase family protein n=1 Tax=Saccharolobus TaxID=2100760 RepID=UPI001F0FF1BC|nr:sugar phosphate isomerase/epimerase [Saccharolobus shibatae]MCH4816262.1 sugar phosphate isomerase/epimerase [Saccharolobus shibatae]